jgi:ligand-binding sensor domain-containing protein
MFLGRWACGAGMSAPEALSSLHHMPSFRYILLGLAAWVPLTLEAQLPPLKFITYTTNHGLQHNFTKKCVQDHKGFIWITTETGLSRFDGVHFENYQYDENEPASLPHNTINDIGVDSTGRIWLGTEKGLCYYSHKSAGFSIVDISTAFDQSPNVLALVAVPKSHIIWFITDKGLFSMDATDHSIRQTSWKKDGSSGINQLYLSSDHRLWIALQRKGFVIYDPQQDKAVSHLSQNWVMTFHEGKNNIMWIGHWQSDQLIAWNMKTAQMKKWSEKDKYGYDKLMIISGIAPSPFGDSLLLLSTQHLGIRQFDIQQESFTGAYSHDLSAKYSLPSDFTNYIYTDNNHILWICTWNGLCKLNLSEQQFRTVELPFLNTSEFQLYNLVEGIGSSAHPGTNWMGVNGCGLIQYYPAQQKIRKQIFCDVLADPITYEYGAWTEFIIETSPGELWSGNDVGIAHLQGDQVTQYEIRINNSAHWKKTICIGPDQTFWISTPSHLVHFDPRNGNYTTHLSLLQGVPIRSVTDSSFCRDQLWIGTVKGLFRFNPRTFQSERVPLRLSGTDSLNINTIHSLVTDGKETIFVGTPAGLGIYHLTTSSFELKGNKENVYPVLWKSMLRDLAGYIWIYTPHALFKYDVMKDEFSKYTTSDGIHNFSSDPVHLFSHGRNFYIGYRGAYTEFDPLKVNKNQTLVQPLITEVWLGSDRLKMDIDSFANTTLKLSSRQNDITFYFTGIDFTNSDKIKFSCQIDTEPEITASGNNRTVSYTNLSPGGHTFRLKAQNSSGIPTPRAAVFHFYITPTLFQRWWFWPSAVMSFVFLVAFLAQRRVKKIRKEEALKTETHKMMAQLETKLLRSQMNPHFIFNSLNSIQKYIWENKEEDAAEYLARFAKLIRAILENSRKETISLREELEVLKLYIDLEHRRSNGKFNYQVKIDENIHPDEVVIPPLLLQPYIENAIWHGVNPKPGRGHISIRVHHENDALEFVIDDDGVGRNFSVEKMEMDPFVKSSAGTEITQQRINHLNTNMPHSGVRIIDKQKNGQPAGTTVIISIPIKYQSNA